MKSPAIPARLQALAADLEKAIEALPRVTRAPMWGSLNFKIGKKLFVCYDLRPEGAVFEFKLPEEEARAAILAGQALPHGFRSHAATGWVKVTVSRKKDAARLLRMVRRSRDLHA